MGGGRGGRKEGRKGRGKEREGKGGDLLQGLGGDRRPCVHLQSPRKIAQ